MSPAADVAFKDRKELKKAETKLKSEMIILKSLLLLRLEQRQNNRNITAYYQITFSSAKMRAEGTLLSCQLKLACWEICIIVHLVSQVK